MPSQVLSLDSVVQRDLDVIATEAGPDVVMVSIAKGHYYGVSDVAREIWDAIDNPVKVSDLIDNLCKNYSVDRSCCEEQTLSFLGDLLDEGLLQAKDEKTD